ncbi:BREX-2 system adenine-specific DNA-methyltransferase PglX, partial [Rhodococcoides fascians]|uniref:BREX-2 system adenine-specific DNA-methyltransferase PglX n=1 Tax=Rhodococcoides fascians TaxID=1828 RepID=UPI0037988924
NLAAGDSLLHGPERGGKDAFDYGDNTYDKDAAASDFTYSTEDRKLLVAVLAPGQYDAVVGNPPYIVVSDKALNARYREIYHYCKGKYALTVPFMERFFQLAKPGHRAGWVGQITSNSFMKREFGVPLIEEFLSTQDLRLVADTSGAYIPGHGTPTIIIVGRNHRKAHETVRAVLGIRGEPGAPLDPAQGLVWKSIVENIDDQNFENQFISVADVSRVGLQTHPWSLSGGGAVETSAAISRSAIRNLSDLTTDIGMTYLSLEDEVFLLPPNTPIGRITLNDSVPVVVGDEVRDHTIIPKYRGLAPVSWSGVPSEPGEATSRYFWSNRTRLSRRLYFGQTPTERGLRWFDIGLFFARRHKTDLSIAFTAVATHNHFVLDRGGKTFNRTAPVIKLPKDATEDDHLRLLGTLNSSTACFWLKQNSHNKGSTVDTSGARTTLSEWENFYEFTGTTLKDFPLPASAPLDRGRRIDALSQALSAQGPATAMEARGATRATIDAARTEHARIRALMIAEQEELDWEVYRNYGLIDEDLTVPVGEAPGLSLGERTFEIVLARKIASGESETAWFARHGSTPITEIPARWSNAYCELIEKRIAAIESNPFIRLLEKPEYKRRWAGETWDTKLQSALKDWLLDRL